MEHVRPGREPVDLLGLGIAGLLIRLELRVAPRLLVGLLRCLRRQLLDEVLDHLHHLVEGARRLNLRSEVREDAALGLLRATLQEDHDAVDGRGALGGRDGRGAEEREGPARLDEGRQMLVRRAGDGRPGHDLDGLRDGLKLLLAHLLARLELLGLRRALRLEVREVSLVHLQRRARRFHLLGEGLEVRQALRLGLRLLLDLVLRLLRVQVQLADERLEGELGLGLLDRKSTRLNSSHR